MQLLTVASALALLQTAYAAENGTNIGGDGTGRGVAQAYLMAENADGSFSLQLNLYDKDVGEAGWEVHGDVILTVENPSSEHWYGMGWCFRPIEDATDETLYDCLSMEFYYDSAKMDDLTSDGYSETFVGYDLNAPKLDASAHVPSAFNAEYLDSNIDAAAANKQGSWTVNTSKSSKVCESESKCVFTGHFFRNFQTDDTSDWQITLGENKMVEAWGFAVEYSDAEKTTATANYVVGDAQNIHLENLAEDSDDEETPAAGNNETQEEQAMTLSTLVSQAALLGGLALGAFF